MAENMEIMEIIFNPSLQYRAFYDPGVPVVSMLSQQYCDHGFTIGDESQIGIITSNTGHFCDLEYFFSSNTRAEFCAKKIRSRIEFNKISVRTNMSFNGFWSGPDELSRGTILLSAEVCNVEFVQLGKNPVSLILREDNSLYGIHMNEIETDVNSNKAKQWIDQWLSNH